MTRNYLRTTKRGAYSKEDLLRAYKMITKDNMKVSQVSEIFNIDRRTLGRYVKKFNEENAASPLELVQVGFSKHSQV